MFEKQTYLNAKNNLRGTMKLIKLKGSKTEEDIRRQLIESHESLFNDEIRSGLLSVIKRFFHK